MIIPFFDTFSIPGAVSNDGNKIVHSRLRKFENTRRHKGYSIKYVMRGEEAYEIDGQSFQVKAGSFLLVNDGTLIHTRIPANETVEGLCIYFSPKLIRKIFGKGKVLRETVYCADSTPLGAKIKMLAEEFANIPTLTHQHQMPWDFYTEMATALFKHQQEVDKELNRLNCVKDSTREELYRRLCIARSYMHAYFSTEIDLDELSREACLSKFHFIRLFSQAFGATPHQYLIRLRLNHAQRLLLTSNLKLTEICHHVGLRDLSSFGRRFKRTFGLSPARYRSKHAKSASVYVSPSAFVS
jgi:AraC-like DNA-binding protein